MHNTRSSFVYEYVLFKEEILHFLFLNEDV